jgi:hypothetical protein
MVRVTNTVAAAARCLTSKNGNQQNSCQAGDYGDLRREKRYNNAECPTRKVSADALSPWKETAMSDNRLLSIFAAIIVAGGMIASAYLIAGAFANRNGTEEIIRVDGSARRVVTSDYIIWTAKVSYEAPTLSAAYASLEQGVDKLRGYLTTKGLTADEVFPLAIATETLYERPPASAKNASYDETTIYRKVAAYKLSQNVEVRSKRVAIVEGISRSVTDLINQGVSLESQQPQYRITNLPELKDSILAEAAKNARSRAERIATSSSATLGPLKASHMGLMQVTGAYEDAEEAGSEDTASLDKKVTVMVSSVFSIR